MYTQGRRRGASQNSTHWRDFPSHQASADTQLRRTARLKIFLIREGRGTLLPAGLQAAGLMERGQIAPASSSLPTS